MDFTRPRSGHRWARRLPGVLATLAVVAGMVAAPATAAPAAPAPVGPLDQSALLSQVVPGLVDINTTLGYQGAAGSGTGIVLDPNGAIAGTIASPNINGPWGNMAVIDNGATMSEETVKKGRFAHIGTADDSD